MNSSVIPNSKNCLGGLFISIEEIIQIELIALGNTILEYSTDNYISSYARQLMSIDYPKERSKLTLLVHRLLEWYDGEMENILSLEFIHSKESHERSYKLLQELHEKLKNE